MRHQFFLFLLVATKNISQKLLRHVPEFVILLSSKLLRKLLGNVAKLVIFSGFFAKKIFDPLSPASFNLSTDIAKLVIGSQFIDLKNQTKIVRSVPEIP